MALLNFEPAPEGLKGQPYKHYRDWLNLNFFNQLCSYCLLQFEESLQIEHFEPQKYAPERVNDPDNLLLGCSWCNSGKKDYHPNHSDRLRLRRVTTDYPVIDIRSENFAELLEIGPSGEVLAKPGEQSDRIRFNIEILLRLNTQGYKKLRAKCFEYLNACEGLLSKSDLGEEGQKAFEVILRECAERYPFFQAFDIPITPELKAHIGDYLAKNKPVLMS